MATMRGIEAAGVFAALVGLSAAGCNEGIGEPDPVDFYVTVHLQTGFEPNVVDRLQVTIQADVDVAFGASEGSDLGGGISWRTEGEGIGNSFVIETTGDYFRTTAAEVSRDTWEIDIPFQGGHQEGSFSPAASVYWDDADGVEREVGYGTQGIFDLPRRVTDPIVIEVNCRPDWQYTCRTACAPAVNPCEDREDCGSGTWACVEGCCVEG